MQIKVSLKKLLNPAVFAAIIAIMVINQPKGQSVPPQSAQPVVLATGKGAEIGTQFEAFLTPHQEPDEESSTPSLTPKQFLSTAPSVERKLRKARGYGVLRFSKDLSKAYVDVKVENLKIEDVNMFHIHCGRPDQLGPILIDFAHSGDLQTSLKNGVMTVELSNDDIAHVTHSGHGPVAAFTAGCPIVPEHPELGKVKTIAGMEHIARKSELYFNLHTKGQTFYGEMRGQIHPVK